MIFWGGFRLFLGNYSNDFFPTWPKRSPYCYRAFAKNRTSKSFSVLEIFSLKVGIFGQDGENGVQRWTYISRTVNAMKNLIWFSESRRNSLSPSSDQIFHSTTSSRWNFRSKMVNFDPKNWRFLGVFRLFLGNYSNNFFPTWSKRSPYCYRAFAKNCTRLKSCESCLRSLQRSWGRAAGVTVPQLLVEGYTCQKIVRVCPCVRRGHLRNRSKDFSETLHGF